MSLGRHDGSTAASLSPPWPCLPLLQLQPHSLPPCPRLHPSWHAGCSHLPRLLLARMADPAPLPKRQRVTTSAAADEAAAAAAAVGPAAQQTAAPPGQQQQQRQQPQAKKVKQVVMPTAVPPPAVPTDPAAWENAVLLIDKPQGWTSFDVCGKLRGALAALLRKKHREVKVGHAGEHVRRLWRCARALASRLSAFRPANRPHLAYAVQPARACQPVITAGGLPRRCAAGTLDPMATGLLIVCVGRGTKVRCRHARRQAHPPGALHGVLIPALPAMPRAAPAHLPPSLPYLQAIDVGPCHITSRMLPSLVPPAPPPCRQWTPSWPCRRSTAAPCAWGRPPPAMTPTRRWRSTCPGSTSQVGWLTGFPCSGDWQQGGRLAAPPCVQTCERAGSATVPSWGVNVSATCTLPLAPRCWLRRRGAAVGAGWLPGGGAAAAPHVLGHQGEAGGGALTGRCGLGARSRASSLRQPPPPASCALFVLRRNPPGSPAACRWAARSCTRRRARARRWNARRAQSRVRPAESRPGLLCPALPRAQACRSLCRPHGDGCCESSLTPILLHGPDPAAPRSVPAVDRFDLWRDEVDAQSVHFRVVCSKARPGVLWSGCGGAGSVLVCRPLACLCRALAPAPTTEQLPRLPWPFNIRPVQRLFLTINRPGSCAGTTAPPLAGHIHPLTGQRPGPRPGLRGALDCPAARGHRGIQRAGRLGD